MSTTQLDAAGNQVPEDAATTRSKILAWAAFTYDVATGRIPQTANYCSHFGGSGSPIASSMVPEGFPFCSTSGQAWTVGRFFTLRCGSPVIFEGNCGGVQGEGLVETVATGALLHLIQDSYSQSHAYRTDAPVLDTRGRALPRVECGKPRTYFAYTKETQKGHSQADERPQWMASCNEMIEADDVLTASAMTLYHLDRRSPTAEFVAYLERRVF
jgi:hypothetical protein